MSTIPEQPHQPVEPFDIPPEPAILPQGESHSLPNSFFNTFQAPANFQMQMPQQSSDIVAEQMRAPNAEQLSQIQTLYKDEDQQLILAWWPHIYLRPSEFVTDKPIVCNAAHVLAHAKGMSKKLGTKQTVGTKDNSYANAHMQWVAECSARKRWIAAKKAEWERRKQERQAWLDSIATTQAQWDAYVEEAKKHFKDAEAYPAPPRPSK